MYAGTEVMIVICHGIGYLYEGSQVLIVICHDVGYLCAGTSVNNNNNKKRSKNNKSPKLCLGDLIIVICHNIINLISF